MLISSTTSNESKYASKEYGDYSKRPSLTVVYIPVPDTSYASLVNASALHSQGITGAGVTVAVVDTGYWSHPALNNTPTGSNRLLAQYNAITNSTSGATDDSGTALTWPAWFSAATAPPGPACTTG